MACNYSLIRKDWYIVANTLPRENRLLFYEAIFRYVFEEEEPQQLPQCVQVMFDLIKHTLAEDKTKSERMAVRNRLNGAKGGRPRKIEDDTDFQIYFYFFSCGVKEWKDVADMFITHYSSRNWMVGNTAITDRVTLTKSWRCDRVADISASRARYCELLKKIKTTDIRMLQEFICIEELENCCIISFISDFCVKIIENNAAVVKSWLKPKETLSYKIKKYE